MDKEVINLCNAMNGIRGIKTFCSCCGHGKKPFRIWFRSTTSQGLFFFARCADRRYWRFGNNWRITLDVGDDTNTLPINYCFESVVEHGETAYQQAEDLIENMRFHYNHGPFMEAFGLRMDDFNLDYVGHYGD